MEPKKFVPEIIAKSLKEIGFTEKCIKHIYIKNKVEHFTYPPVSYFGSENKDLIIDVPNWDDVEEWFRTKWGLHLWVNPEIGYTTTYTYNIIGEHYSGCYEPNYKSHLEARTDAFKRAIQMIKKKIGKTLIN